MNDHPVIQLEGNPDNILVPIAGNVGYDIIADNFAYYSQCRRFIEYSTNLKIQMPEGYFGAIFPRSSVSKYDLVLCNSVGVIDPSYRGEIKVRFKITSDKTIKIYQKGDKIAQLILLPYILPIFEPVDKLPETNRGEGGFGSTGK